MVFPLASLANWKTVVVLPQKDTETVLAFSANGLTLCNPVPGTTGAITVQGQHGKATIVSGSYPQPDCGTTMFPGVQANYQWTDTTPAPEAIRFTSIFP